eukprot:TRINITY_DN5426_c0_g1_i4.p1 TRINITY_DN5426_c0_g1~~TRINITY_DN5426_c0_g1_i4.p1  ORF type:complete len:183 (-),score=47.65 TRINITY_DN5426_c0_g1_i4:72-620(-)
MSGVGGNAIQFAQFFHTVYAIDNNRERLELAKHNAQVYGVQEKIHFLAGDFLKILEYWRFRVDAVFLSPPWGGPAYSNADSFDLTVTQPNIIEVFNIAKQISNNICIYLPRNTNIQQIEALAVGATIEIEEVHLSNKLKALSVYFGDLVGPLEDTPPEPTKQRRRQSRKKSQKKRKTQNQDL